MTQADRERCRDLCRELREKAAKATAGPWRAIRPRKVGKHWCVGTPREGGGFWVVARIDNGAPGDTLDTEAANAELCAAVRTHIEELCALAERLAQEEQSK